MGSTSTSDHLPGLDGLRALACLAVFGVHWQQFTGFAASAGPFDARRLLENGNTGVAVLFALSAFLLSLPFWSARFDPSAWSWQDYARSRAVRILPAYYACVLGLALLRRELTSESGMRSVLLHLVFLHNWTERTFYSLSPPFWTVAVQVQSYVVMPIVTLALVRATPSRPARAAALVALALASYAVHWALLSERLGGTLSEWAASNPTVAEHTVLAHMPHFLLGMLAAVAYASRRGVALGEHTRGWLWDVSVFIAVAGTVVILSTPLDDVLSVPFGRYNLPFVPVVIAWMIFAIPQAPIARTVLDWAPVRLAGVISYGVFVYHYACMEVTARLMREVGLEIRGHVWLFGIGSLVATVIIAALSYRYFEEPLRRRFHGRPRPAPAG